MTPTGSSRSDAEVITSTDQTPTPEIVEHSATDRQRLFVSALCVGAALSFYVLSAGPMSGLARVLQLQSFTNAVEVIYKPLIVIVKRDVRPFSTVLRWYAGLFR